MTSELWGKCSTEWWASNSKCSLGNWLRRRDRVRLRSASYSTHAVGHNLPLRVFSIKANQVAGCSDRSLIPRYPVARVGNWLCRTERSLMIRSGRSSAGACCRKVPTSTQRFCTFLKILLDTFNADAKITVGITSKVGACHIFVTANEENSYLLMTGIEFGLASSIRL